jgi:voltage-gated potassium channel Kch
MPSPVTTRPLPEPAPRGTPTSRVVVIGDLEPTRLVCALLAEEGVTPVHLLDPDEPDLRRVLAGPADAVAIVVRGDLLALRFALLVEHLQPGVRVVVTIFDRTLGRHLEDVLPRCTVTSPADVAAPAIAAACLDDDALAVLAGPDGPCALVGREGEARLVPWSPGRTSAGTRLARWWPHRYGGSEGLLMAGLGGLLGTLVVEWVLAATVLHEGLLQALYGSARLVATVGPAAAEVHDAPGWYLVVSALLMLVGIAFTGALVAGLVEWIVGSRTASLVGPRRVPTRGHVVVSGLGQVGLRVAQLLRELDVPVVVVERLADVPNLPVARAARVPVVVGDAGSRAVLDRVRVRRARAVAALGSEDLDNVAVVINALAVAPGVRTVLRAGEGTAVTETTSLFRIGHVSDVSVMTAAWVCASVRGEQPVAAWSGAHRVGVLTADSERRRGVPQRCTCSD